MIHDLNNNSIWWDMYWETVCSFITWTVQELKNFYTGERILCNNYWRTDSNQGLCRANVQLGESKWYCWLHCSTSACSPSSFSLKLEASAGDTDVSLSTNGIYLINVKMPIFYKNSFPLHGPLVLHSSKWRGESAFKGESRLLERSLSS